MVWLEVSQVDEKRSLGAIYKVGSVLGPALSHLFSKDLAESMYDS